MSDATTANRRLLGIGLAVTLLVALVVAQFASADPDGLEYVLEEHGLDETARDHAFADFALAEYGENLGDHDVLNTAIAGLIGVTVTLAIGFGVLRTVSRRDARD